MLSNKLLKSLNEQIKHEFIASQQYLAMSGYFASQNLSGFSSFLQAQVEEEFQHGLRFFEFISVKGGTAIMPDVEQPQNEYKSILEPFEAALKYEKEGTQRLYDVMNLAIEEKEHSTISFLKAFMDIQVKEVAEFETLVHQLRFVAKDGNGIYMLNQRLGTGGA